MSELDLPKVQFFDSSKLPMTIICNGFSMKDVIMKVLNSNVATICMDDCYMDKLADDIQEAFAVKLGLKQGS